MLGTPSENVVQDRGAVLCHHCHQQLTGGSQAIAVGGSHEHTFDNPGGYRFEIGCFADAPGAVAAGEASSEKPWFEGYTWQRAFCGGCRRHVGWLFRSRSHVFYALVRELEEPDSDEP